MDSITAVVKEMTEKLAPALDSLSLVVTQTVKPALKSIVAAAGPAFDSITAAAGPAFDSITAAAGPTIDSVTAAATEKLGPITAVVSKTLQDLVIKQTIADATQTLGALPIELAMVLLLVVICFLLLLLSCTLTLDPKYLESQTWLPSKHNAAKREWEMFSLQYTALWIAVFAVVIALQLYESFTASSYMLLCVPLALPFLLQPLLYPLPAERCLPLFLRYSFKANVWLAIFSFVGNYWYTHYFYSVLKASYTFPAHRLNDVPIALFFATHFYFCTYHTLANLLLRRIETRYAPGTARSLFFWGTVVAFSYFTAFMETLTISSFPYYSFEDRYG
ncbi:hypothetical protein B484DRAFT_103271 [Ochromonadaceae sp. CCMP2298]|nr:hypothetical protein B484DRAFT_103271 [Ochromonadaceae sp. CCMP2298]